jgi:hypothetical protein
MKKVNIEKIYDRIVKKYKKYSDEATGDLSFFYVAEEELFVALYFHTKGNLGEVKKILKHEYAHYDEAIRQGYKPSLARNP